MKTWKAAYPLILAILILMPAPFADAAPPVQDPQDALIRQVLVSTVNTFGWSWQDPDRPPEITPPKVSDGAAGEVFFFAANVYVRFTCHQADPDLDDERFLQLETPVGIAAYETEEMAKEDFMSDMEDWKTDPSFNEELVRGYPAFSYLSSTVEVQAGRFMFTVLAVATPGYGDGGWCEAHYGASFRDIANVLVDQAVRAGLISGKGEALEQDLDGDGVADEQDQCPNTPPGVDVDVAGCTLAGEAIELRALKRDYNETRKRVDNDQNAGSVVVSGTVTDKTTGEPIEEATVEIVSGANPASTKTNPSGGYSLTAVVPSGEPGVSSKTVDLLLEGVPAAQITIDTLDVIPVPGELLVHVTAVDGEGNPIEGVVEASIVDEDDASIAFAITNQDPTEGYPLDDEGKHTFVIKTVKTSETVSQWDVSYAYLRDIPLKAKIKVKIDEQYGSRTLGEKEIVLPFNLSRIHGVTADERGAPFDQTMAPELGGLVSSRRESIVVDSETGSEGTFWLLLRPIHPGTGTPLSENLITGEELLLRWPVGTQRFAYAIHEEILNIAPGESVELYKVGRTPYEWIVSQYRSFGRSPHTWPDGTREATPLVGPADSGAGNNAKAMAVGGEYWRYCCVALQYKTLWFLDDLANRTPDDPQAKYLSQLRGWDYEGVYYVNPGEIYKTVIQHNAVALWDKLEGEAFGTTLPLGKPLTTISILDPWPEQEPKAQSADYVLASWHVDQGNLQLQRDQNWSPPWTATWWPPWGEASTAVSGDCPVDVLITNSQGQRLGVLENGDTIAEFNPVDLDYWRSKDGDRQWFFALPADTYNVELRGTGSGTFRLLTAPSRQAMHDYGENPIAAGEQAVLTMDAEKDQLTLADGSQPPFEVIHAEASSASDLSSAASLHLLLFGVGGAAGLCALGFLTALLLRRRRPEPAAVLASQGPQARARARRDYPAYSPPGDGGGASARGATRGFEELERRYYVLKGKQAAGRLSDEQFQDEVGKLRLRDEQGRFWTLGGEAGTWYVAQGGQWVRAEPPHMASGRACPNCGARTKEGLAFCTSCGQRLMR